MITKTTFCNILENVKNIEKKFKHLEAFIGQPICECDFYNYTANILDALTEELNIELIGGIYTDLIYDFAYNHNWGEDGEFSVNIYGVDKTASNFEELYDLIKELTEYPE